VEWHVLRTGSVIGPRDLGDIVSAAWLLCVGKWRQVLLMASVTWFGVLLLDIGLLALAAHTPRLFVLAYGAPRPPVAFAALMGAGLMLVFYNQLALVGFALEASILGTAQVGRCYGRAVRGYLPALGAILITSVVFTAGSAIWLGIPVAVFFLVSWFFAAQVCLAEGSTNSVSAIRRSRAIVGGSWWRTAGVLVGLSLLGLLPSLAVAAIRPSQFLPGLVLPAFALAISAPFLASAQTILYLDLRLRKHEPISLASG